MSLFKDNEKYVVNVIDLSSPDTKWFTVGINGDVQTFPTNKRITLTGVQIKVLQNAVHEEATVKTVDGLNEIVGHTTRPRFAVNVLDFGTMPTDRVPDLSKPTVSKEIKPKENIDIETEDDEMAENEDTDTLPPVDKITEEERKEQLDAATRQELMSFCKGNGISVSPTDSKTTLIGKILKNEGYSVR